MIVVGKRHTSGIAWSLMTVLMILLAARSAPSQQMLWEINDPSSTFGSLAHLVGDADGDGLSEIAVVDPFFFGQQVGRIWIFSGATQQVIQVFDTPPGEFNFWSLGPVGDVDGDGFADLGTVSNAHRRVYSILTGQVILMDAGFLGVGDVTGDGKADLLDNWTYAQQLQVRVYSGTDGSLLYTLTAPPLSSIPFGLSFAPLDDIDGDGTPDFVLGSPGAATFPCCPGHAHVYSGATGALLYAYTGPGIWSRFGDTVGGVADVDGDLVMDLAVFAPGGPGWLTPNALGGYGQTWIYSGATGQHLNTFDCPPGSCPNNFDSAGNTRLVGLHDVDGDGSGDYCLDGVFVAGSPIIAIQVRSGRDGSTILTIPSAVGVRGSGHDFDGDGLDDLLVAYTGTTSPSAPGRAFAWSLLPPGVTRYGAGCPDPGGTEPTIGARGMPAAGQTFTINLSDVPAGASASLILGLSDAAWGPLALPFDLGPATGIPGCALLASADDLLPTTTAAFGPLAAWASMGWALPTSLQATGMTLFAQWLVLEPPGGQSPFRLSRGLRIEIQ